MPNLRVLTGLCDATSPGCRQRSRGADPALGSLTRASTWLSGLRSVPAGRSLYGISARSEQLAPATHYPFARLIRQPRPKIHWSKRGYVRYPTSSTFRSSSPTHPSRVRAQPFDLRHSRVVVVQAAPRCAVCSGRRVRQAAGDSHRAISRATHPAQPEHYQRVAVRRPFHRAENSADP